MDIAITSTKPNPFNPSPSSRDVMATAAQRRWDADLHRAFAASPITYGEIIGLITREIEAAATGAEMTKRGGGLEYIVMALRLSAGGNHHDHD